MGEGVVAFSSTRHGGCSKGNYAAFNINRYCGDDEEDIRKNREALCRLLGIGDDRLVMPHQVHETKVAKIDKRIMALNAIDRHEALEGVDALMTNLKGVCIGVSTADCIPVLLYDKAHQAVCAIHAGWRGTLKRIVTEAVEAMTEAYGTQPQQLVAQIGPGIQEPVQQRLRMIHHQMNIQRYGKRFLQSPYGIRRISKVRNKVRVHDIHMQPVAS